MPNVLPAALSDPGCADTVRLRHVGKPPSARTTAMARNHSKAKLVCLFGKIEGFCPSGFYQRLEEPQPVFIRHPARIKNIGALSDALDIGAIYDSRSSLSAIFAAPTCCPWLQHIRRQYPRPPPSLWSKNIRSTAFGFCFVL